MTFSRSQYPALVGVLSVLVGDRWVAEDLAQEALARAWNKWSRVASLDRPDLWTRRVALNLARSLWRRKQVAARAGRLVVASDRPGQAPIAAHEALREAVGRLPGRQRAAIAFRYFDDMTVAETARTMGCKDGTVRALTSQAISSLRKALPNNQEVTD